MAEHLHQSGMDVIVHYNNSAKEAEALAARLNGLRHDSAATIQADLKHGQDYTAVMAAALAFKGRLDALINNASAFYPTPITTLTGNDWDTLINTNLKAPLFLAQQAAPGPARKIKAASLILPIFMPAGLWRRTRSIAWPSRSGYADQIPGQGTCAHSGQCHSAGRDYLAAGNG